MGKKLLPLLIVKIDGCVDFNKKLLPKQVLVVSAEEVCKHFKCVERATKRKKKCFLADAIIVNNL